MKRLSSIFLGLGLLAVAGSLSAQQPAAVVDSSTTAVDYKIEVYQKENIPFKAPIPYAYVREADIMYEKIVWRMIELREKQNLPLYYPTAPIGSRVNLVNLLLKGVESGEITPYDPNDMYNEFSRKIGKDELDQNFGAKNDTIFVSDENGNMIPQIRNVERRIDEVKRLFIKEKIYFDKKHSLLNRVVIGICPIRVYSRDGSEDASSLEMMRTMWVYMPEARKVLSRHPVFNRFNDAQNISFDDFFMQNRYAGHIYQVSNVFNNRAINEYASGIDALYEAKRIEDEIFDWEQDLWEY
jgi:gliding motility associated protien GldN